MAKWSEELREMTRREIFSMAVVKNEEHDYGIVMTIAPKVVINGIQAGAIMPVASDEMIATFDSVSQMIDAGWVLD